jgi:hypothetical protein
MMCGSDSDCGCGFDDSGTGCGSAGALGYGGVINYVTTLKGSVKITELHSIRRHTQQCPMTNLFQRDMRAV